jgi:hypothetical protein
VIVLALLLVATALGALALTVRRVRQAAEEAILTLGVTRRELRPALVLARDDARRAATLRAPRR